MIYALWTCLSALFLFNACVDEDDFDFDRLSQTVINPYVEANLLSMDFTARDFLNQITDSSEGLYLMIGEDSAITLRMIQDFEVGGEDLEMNYFNDEVSFVETDFNVADITVPSLPFAFTDDIVIADNITEKVGIPPFEKSDDNEAARVIDSVLLSAGKLSLSVLSRMPCDVEIVLKSNDIVNKNTGVPLSATVTVGTSDNTVVTDIDLADNIMKFSPVADSSYINFTYSVVAKTKDLTVPGGTYGFNMKINGDNLDIDVAWGKVGNPKIPVEGILNIDFFSDTTTNVVAFDLKNIYMNFDVVNYTGIGISLDISDVTTRTSDGYTESLFARGTTQTIADALEINTPKTTSFTLTPNTAAFSKLPGEILYNMIAEFGDGMQNVFIRPKYKYLDVHTVIDIPMNAAITDFVSQKETSELDFLKDEDGVGDYVDSVMLKLDLDNTFPAELRLDILAQDDKGNITYIGDKSVIVKSGNINAQGEVISSSNQTETLTVSSDNFRIMRNADKILFRIVFNTPEYNGQKTHVLFRSDSKLSIKLGMKVNSRITL